jgi:hypothetical protein
LDYQGNSRKERDRQATNPEKKVERIVDAEVVSQPKSLTRKFKDIFVAVTLKRAGQFVFAEVIVPRARQYSYEVIDAMLQSMFFGRSRYDRRPDTTHWGGARVQYNRPVSQSRTILYPDEPRGRLPESPRSLMRVDRRNTDDLLVGSREDAEKIIEGLIDILDKYDMVSMADLNQMIGREVEPIDNKWGWTYLSMHNLSYRQTRDGYLIELPPTEALV